MPALFACDNRPVTPGRNEPCPCGSGKKYKQCCGELRPAVAAPANPAIKPFSHDAQTHHEFGNALHDRGDYAGAAASQRRAVQLIPGFAEAHDSLGSALLALGQPAAAVLSYRRAVDLKPNLAEARGNLGNALSDLGKWDEAVLHYRHMLALRPRSPEAHNNLGNALLALQRFEEAAGSYRQALDIRPSSAGALTNLANALREMGRPQEALTHCRRALELQPQVADAYLIQGNAQFDLGLLDEAAASYARVLELEVGSVWARISLAKVLRQTGRGAEAETRCREALHLSPNSAEALALLGELRADGGDFTDAEKLFRLAIEVAPDLPEAWASLARYRKMAANDAPWLTTAQRLVAKPLAIGRQINLRYAIGKYFDDLQDFDSAFSSYRLANELSKRAGIEHDPLRMSRRVDEIIRSYDARWLRQAEAAGSQSARPVFIIGMPRSGTTLTEHILASHSEVFGAGELRFWHSATVNFQNSRRAGQDGIGAITEVARASLRHLAALSADAARVIDKMPANFVNLGLIHAAFPNARIIHMRRNPLDTALSIYFQVFSSSHSYANDLADIAQHYAQYLRLMQHWRNTLPKAAMLEVCYEKLVEDPESCSRSMVEFLGLPWEPRCLEFHQTQRNVTTASNWQVRQKITRSSAGRWRNYAQHLGPLRDLADRESLA